jgi:hypothetical protein
MRTHEDGILYESRSERGINRRQKPTKTGEKNQQEPVRLRTRKIVGWLRYGITIPYPGYRI